MPKSWKQGSQPPWHPHLHDELFEATLFLQSGWRCPITFSALVNDIISALRTYLSKVSDIIYVFGSIVLRDSRETLHEA